MEPAYWVFIGGPVVILVIGLTINRLCYHQWWPPKEKTYYSSQTDGNKECGGFGENHWGM